MRNSHEQSKKVTAVTAFYKQLINNEFSYSDHLPTTATRHFSNSYPMIHQEFAEFYHQDQARGMRYTVM